MRFPQQDIWNIDELPEAARAALRDMDEQSNEQDVFASLLDSGSVAARGYAVEIYALMQSDTRWGTEHPLASFADRVRDCAVGLLESPPLALGECGALVAEANHASALHAMWTVAKYEDVAVILRSLRTSRTPLTQTGAARAALFWLQDWRDRRPSELGEAMRALVGNTAIARSARCIGMRCLLSYRDQEGEAVLLSASRESDMAIATNAAWVLTHLDLEKHRDHLEALVEAWGDDPPYLGDEVREALGIV